MPVENFPENCQNERDVESPSSQSLLANFLINPELDIDVKCGIQEQDFQCFTHDSTSSGVSSLSSIPSVKYKNESIVTLSKCLQKQKSASLEVLPVHMGDNSFHGVAIDSQISCGNYTRRSPLIAIHHNSNHPKNLSEMHLPPDLIRKSLTLDSGPRAVESSVKLDFTSISKGLTDSEKPNGDIHQSFCSCKTTGASSFPCKICEHLLIKSEFSSGQAVFTAIPSSVESADPLSDDEPPACWCWGSKLVLYTIYLCIVFVLVIFSEAARMVMIPITVFLILLSLALFLFILFCVCFIIFI